MKKSDIANKPNITKATLVQALIAEGFDEVQAQTSVDKFFAVIAEELARGKEVRLSGFGNFYLIQKNARPAQNPKTGEAVIIAPRRVVGFRAGRKLRALVESDNLE